MPGPGTAWAAMQCDGDSAPLSLAMRRRGYYRTSVLLFCTALHRACAAATDACVPSGVARAGTPSLLVPAASRLSIVPMHLCPAYSHLGRDDEGNCRTDDERRIAQSMQYSAVQRSAVPCTPRLVCTSCSALKVPASNCLTIPPQLDTSREPSRGSFIPALRQYCWRNGDMGSGN